MDKHLSVVKFSIVAALVLVLAPAASYAGQDPPPGVRPSVTLAGRHALAVRVGALTPSTRTTISSDGASTGSSTDVLGELSYVHWLREDWGIGLSGGALALGAKTGVSAGGMTPVALPDGVSGEATFRSPAVTAVLFDVRYQPAHLAIAGSARPYVSLGVGPWVATGENVRVGSDVIVDSVFDAEFGFRALAGVDWHLGRRFKAGVSGGYHFVGRFDEPVGSYRDYRGPEFAIGFGILFGAGR